MSDKQEYTVGSGNVFADLGHHDPDTALAKADIAGQIASIIDRRGWNQREAADALGLDQPKVSHLVRGRLRDFSLERLMKVLTKLDQDVQIVSRPNPEPERAARLGYSGSGWSGDGIAAAPTPTDGRVSFE
ncbi:MAG: XRE family transcriptional regulator [Chloroflexia bacterium]|nr:XRE family transcriptional regulator [Chloroflexia bacterium]